MMRVLAVALVAGVVASPAMGQFDPNSLPFWHDDYIDYIQVSNMTVEFDPAGPAGGLLEVTPKTGGPDITLHYRNMGDESLTPGADGVLYIMGTLFRESSSGGTAIGEFNGDFVGNPDWELGWNNIMGSGVDLTFLEGEVNYYKMQEYLDTGMFSGGGRIQATGGILTGEPGWPSGTDESSLTSFTFDVYEPGTTTPLNVSDFSQGFVGDIYLTFYPDDEHGIPEPTTLALLAGGMLIALRRRS